MEEQNKTEYLKTIYRDDPTFRWEDDIVEDTESVKAESDIITDDLDEQNKTEQFPEKIISTNEQQNYQSVLCLQQKLFQVMAHFYVHFQ